MTVLLGSPLTAIARRFPWRSPHSRNAPSAQAPLTAQQWQQYSDRFLAQILECPWSGYRPEVDLAQVFLWRIETLDTIDSPSSNMLQQGLDRAQLSLADLVADHRQLVILGSPGAGKSILLKYVALALLQSPPPSALPLWLDLAHLGVSVSLDQAIARSLAPFGITMTRRQIHRALTQGQFCLLMDNADEITHRKPLLTQVTGWLANYPNNRYLLTCRTSAYTTELPGVVAELAGWEAIATAPWFCPWAMEETGTSLSTRQAWTTHQGLSLSPHTPALDLSLYRLLMEQRADPTLSIQQRSHLYGTAVQHWLTEWIDTNLAPLGPSPANASIFSALASLAYESLWEGQRSISQQDWYKALEEILPQPIAELPAPLPLLQPQGDRLWFGLRSLQDYLAAHHLDHHPDALSSVLEHLDRGWNALLWWADLHPHPGAMLVQLAQQSPQTLDPAAQALLSWVDRVTSGSPGALPEVAKRVVVLYLVLCGTGNDRLLSVLRALSRQMTDDLAVDTMLTFARETMRALALDSDPQRAQQRHQRLMAELVQRLEQMQIFNRSLEGITASDPAAGDRPSEELPEAAILSLAPHWLQGLGLPAGWEKATVLQQLYQYGRICLLLAKCEAIASLSPEEQQAFQRQLVTALPIPMAIASDA